MNEDDKDTLCRRIVETVGDAVIFADRDGIIRLWNQAAEGIFGYMEEEAIGQSLDLIIPERQRELHWKGYGKAMANGVSKYGSETLSVPAGTKNGERISIEFTISLLRDDDGKVLGPVAVVRDVTAKWYRERLMRQKNCVPGGRTDNAVIRLEIDYSSRALYGQVSQKIAYRLDGFFRICPSDDQTLADDVIPTFRGPDEVAPERLLLYFIARHGCK